MNLRIIMRLLLETVSAEKISSLYPPVFTFIRKIPLLLGLRIAYHLSAE